MRFTGTNNKIKDIFKILIRLYGTDATVADVQRSIAIVQK